MAEDVRFHFILSGKNEPDEVHPRANPHVFTDMAARHVVAHVRQLNRKLGKPGALINRNTVLRFYHLDFQNDQIRFHDHFFPPKGIAPIELDARKQPVISWSPLQPSDFVKKSSPMSIVDLYHAIRHGADPATGQGLVLDVSMYSHGFVEGPVLRDSTDRFDGTLYRGRFLRHMRDGHIIIPLTGAKIFTHSDVGGLFEVGHLQWKGMDPASLGIIKTALLVDVSRSRDFHERIAFGPVASWDVDLAGRQAQIADHRIAPFSAGRLELHFESSDGLTLWDLHGDAGTAWHSETKAWHPQVQAETSLERIVLAINDRPIALYALAHYDSLRAETIAALGVRIVLFDKTDPRVSRL